MQYKDLPKEDLVHKITKVNFKNPSLNLEFYKWGNKILEELNFIENERVKLIKLYGTEKDGNYSIDDKDKKAEFFKKFKETLELEISDIPKLSVTLEDFESNSCLYPKENKYWLNAEDIGTIMSIKEKQ